MASTKESPQPNQPPTTFQVVSPPASYPRSGDVFTEFTETGQTKTSTSFYGPMSKDYAISDADDLTSTIWSPCGAPIALNIDSAVLLRSSVAGASGQITDDSIDGKITFVTGVQWQKC